MNKQQILEKWEAKIKETESNGQFLWKIQAMQNHFVIKNSTIQKALEILESEYKKYSDMGIASFIKEAIDDLRELKN